MVGHLYRGPVQAWCGNVPHTGGGPAGDISPPLHRWWLQPPSPTLVRGMSRTLEEARRLVMGPQQWQGEEGVAEPPRRNPGCLERDSAQHPLLEARRWGHAPFTVHAFLNLLLHGCAVLTGSLLGRHNLCWRLADRARQMHERSTLSNRMPARTRSSWLWQSLYIGS